MRVDKVIIHELSKPLGTSGAKLSKSKSLMDNTHADVIELISELNKRYRKRDEKQGIFDVINNSVQIVFAAKRDHDMVLKSFDFANFRDSLYKEKEKYFANTRDIINKIFNQAIGIPISISATVFATYKVSNDTLMLLLVWASFILYTIFYIKIQQVYKGDIQELQIDFINDFEIIKAKSGLPENLIKTEKEKIERKISSSLTMIKILTGVVIFFGLLVTWYIFYEVGESEVFCLIRLIFGKR